MLSHEYAENSEPMLEDETLTAEIINTIASLWHGVASAPTDGALRQNMRKRSKRGRTGVKHADRYHRQVKYERSRLSGIKPDLETEDLFQDLVVLCLKKRAQIASAKHMRSYVKTILVNRMTAMMRFELRKRARTSAMVVPLTDELNEGSRQLRVCPELTVLHSHTSEEVIMLKVEELAEEFSSMRAVTVDSMREMLRELSMLREDVNSTTEELAILRMRYDAAKAHHLPIRKALEVHGITPRTTSRIVARLRVILGLREAA